MHPGIDLHKWYAQVVVIDSEDQTVEEVRITNANLDGLARCYAGFRMVIEATSSCYHVYDMLAECLDVTVAHPSKLTLIVYPDKEIDRVDAKELAWLL